MRERTGDIEHQEIVRADCVVTSANQQALAGHYVVLTLIEVSRSALAR
jgi:hypothetical protein